LLESSDESDSESKEQLEYESKLSSESENENEERLEYE
jgi:hypothetical protein